MRRVWGGVSLWLAMSCAGPAARQAKPTAPVVPVSSASVPSPPTEPEAAQAATPSTLQGTCKRLAEKNQPGKVPLPEQDDPEVKIAPLAGDDFPWESIGKCRPAGDGAWALDLTGGAKRLDESEAALMGLSLDLVFVDAQGAESRVELPVFSGYVAGFSKGSVALDVVAVADLVGDARPEIALCVSALGQEYRGPDFYVPQPFFQCDLFGVERPGPGMPAQIARADTAPIASFLDADQDGRMDYVSPQPFGYPGRPGYCSLKSFACMDDLQDPIPKLLYHSVPGGFNPGDGAAYDYAKQQCPKAPKKADFDVDPTLGAGNTINVVMQVACAVFWHVPYSQSAAWLAKAAGAMCQDASNCEEFEALSAWLTYEVPVDLSQPRPK